MKYPILAIDFGTKRIGLAISDDLGKISSPIDPILITKKTDESSLLAKFEEVIVTNHISSILIGVPQEFEESHKKSTEKIYKFINWLTHHIQLPYKVWDESFSTSIAQDMIVSAGRRIRSRKNRIDSMAASVFLQEFLSSKQNTNENS